MKPTSPKFSNFVQLSPKEYTVLRAHLMGFSDLALTQLLDCSKQALQALWFELFKKFKVDNSYMVVKKVLQMGLIEEGNYHPEFLKEATLAFIDKYGASPINHIEDLKSKWESYQYLLKYHNYINQCIDDKKIPPKRD